MISMQLLLASPGSYTGLRIGVSVAKGLCYGTKLPLIAVSTLKILYNQLIANPDTLSQEALKRKDTLICPMIDARRMEVFTCLYTLSGELAEGVSARIIDAESYKQHLLQHPVIFLGSGMDKCREVLSHPNAVFAADIYPHAASLALLAEEAFIQGHFEDPAYFEPFYLKDFVATVPKKL
jgi:tRNA threonylcarbamoyladenosine biosynthesis protein TsaB